MMRGRVQEPDLLDKLRADGWAVAWTRRPGRCNLSVCRGDEDHNIRAETLEGAAKLLDVRLRDACGDHPGD